MIFKEIIDEDEICFECGSKLDKEEKETERNFCFSCFCNDYD